MPASYPSSIKTFTTKTNGTTADASHINDPQAEITAIETDLINGLPLSRGGLGVTSAVAENRILVATSATTAAFLEHGPGSEQAVIAGQVF